MGRYDWSRLNALQVGRYAEYYVKMEFTLWGFDVYTAEVDDHGIDFVVRKDQATYYDVQVKSIRGLNYIFMPKDKFELRANMLAAVVLLREGLAPALYLIPALAWSTSDPLLVSRDYVGKKSAPEWGLNLSQRNLALLEAFRFEPMMTRL
jgi:hypothetical protein